MSLADLAKEIVATLREDLNKRMDAALEALTGRFERLEEAVKAFPTKGEKGEPGEPGKQGEPGEPAPSLTEKQIEQAFKSFMKADPWDAGKAGPGHDMMKKMVAEAVAAAVKEIPAPQNGIDGKDALHLDIMPSIDVDKSVSRGTYATHNGGLWRSFQKTDGMKGWECIVDGVAGVDVQLVGERGFTLQLSMASGAKVEKEFELPAMVYRGVHNKGEKYVRGDTVTSAGSLWHCEKETTEEPGAGSTDWKLAAKRGRDGADGKPGKQGERGLPGKDGRDNLNAILKSR